MNQAEILKLFNKNLLKLGFLADQKRQEIHPDNEPVTFVVDRNINYTNICTCKCRFCAFYKENGQQGGYVLNYAAVKRKINELINEGGTQLLLQGGLNPDLNLDFYLDLISKIRADFPDLTIHAFSPPEIDFISKSKKTPARQLIQEFISCGLSSIPGGGAEILVDKVRSRISPNKINSSRWLEIMKIAHEEGLKTTATMVTGFGESYEDIAEHLLKVRKLQEETGGFTAFIPWTFAKNNTELGKEISKNSTAFDYLKILAVSRIVLDNIPNIQASWVTQGMDIAQLALRFGANDFGGTMLEENVVKAAGVKNTTTTEEIKKYIRKAGFIPAQRDTGYNILNVYE